MPEARQSAEELLRRAAEFRRLAREHAAAGNPEIAVKLSLFAAELEAKAACEPPCDTQLCGAK